MDTITFTYEATITDLVDGISLHISVKKENLGLTFAIRGNILIDRKALQKQMVEALYSTLVMIQIIGAEKYKALDGKYTRDAIGEEAYGRFITWPFFVPNYTYVGMEE